MGKARHGGVSALFVRSQSQEGEEWNVMVNFTCQLWLGHGSPNIWLSIISECVWGCFWMRRTFELIVKKITLSSMGGLIQSIEGLNRAEKGRGNSFFQTVHKQGHQSSPDFGFRLLNWNLYHQQPWFSGLWTQAWNYSMSCLESSVCCECRSWMILDFLVFSYMYSISLENPDRYGRFSIAFRIKTMFFLGKSNLTSASTDYIHLHHFPPLLALSLIEDRPPCCLQWPFHKVWRLCK